MSHPGDTEGRQSGVSPEDLSDLVSAVHGLPGIRVQGLMYSAKVGVIGCEIWLDSCGIGETECRPIVYPYLSYPWGCREILMERSWKGPPSSVWAQLSLVHGPIVEGRQ